MVIVIFCCTVVIAVEQVKLVSVKPTVFFVREGDVLTQLPVKVNIAVTLDLPLMELLGRAATLIYGTTRATNAIVTGQTAKTALLTTRGFRDVLVLREGGKFDPHDFSKPYPKPYIPRRHTFEIAERTNAEGEIVTGIAAPGTHDWEASADTVIERGDRLVVYGPLMVLKALLGDAEPIEAAA